MSTRSNSAGGVGLAGLVASSLTHHVPMSAAGWAQGACQDVRSSVSIRAALPYIAMENLGKISATCGIIRATEK